MRFLLILFPLILVACSTFSAADREEASMHLQIGTSQLQNGNLPSALQELLLAEKLDDENPYIQNNLGLTYFLRERVDLAEIHIRKALELQPNYSDARNNLSRVLIERGKYNEAATAAQIVIDDLTYQNPEKPQINLGIARFKMNQFDSARMAFLKAIDFSRDNCLANSYYGRSLFELKDYKKATDALDRAVGFCQRAQFDEPHYYSALAYFEVGQKSKSVARFEEMIKLYPRGKYIDKAKEMLETIRR